MDERKMEIVKDAFLANIGSVISKHREKQGLTQEYLAKEIGADRSSVTKYEKGSTDIKASTMAYISLILGFPLSEYMHDAQADNLPGDKPIPLDDILKDLSGWENVPKTKKKAAKSIVSDRPPKPDLVYSESEGWVMVPRSEQHIVEPVVQLSEDAISEIRKELREQERGISAKKIDAVRSIYISLAAMDDSEEKERASLAKATLSYILCDFPAQQRKRVRLYLEYASRLKMFGQNADAMPNNGAT